LGERVRDLKSIARSITDKGTDHGRVIVAVAGAPGSGKSYLSEEICAILPKASAQIVPMDGFHYDDAVLYELGLRNRKGAPETFDFEGFEATLKRLRLGRERVAVPVFDRSIELSRAGGRLIDPATRYVLVEGNYLLFDHPLWSRLKSLFDLSIFIDVPIEDLRQRLMARWLDLGHTEDAARAWVEGNDMKNVALVLASRLEADILWATPGVE
jgi:pantothenate kinase